MEAEFEEVPNGDRGQVGAGAAAEGRAVGYVVQHGHLDARTWRVNELCDAASSLRLTSSSLLSYRSSWHSREYALLVDIIIFLLCFFNLYVHICRISRGTHRTTLLRTRTHQWPSGQLGPTDLSSECLVVLVDLCYISDLWYMWWTCVICIGVIVVFVNYIFVIITACNVHVFRYISIVFVSKNREKINKRKIWPLCRVHKPKHSAKWPLQVSRKRVLPSAKVLAHDKVSRLCRVPGI